MNDRLIFENYYPRLCSFFFVRVKNYAIAEELAQETMFQVLLNRSTLKDWEKLTSWILTIAANQYKNHLRHYHAAKRNGFETSLDESWPEVSFSDDPGNSETDGYQFQELLAKELRAQFHQALNDLPERQLNCFLLWYVEDKKYKEIAEIMGVSIHTIKSTLSAARKNIRSLMLEKTSIE